MKKLFVLSLLILMLCSSTIEAAADSIYSAPVFECCEIPWGLNPEQYCEDLGVAIYGANSENSLHLMTYAGSISYFDESFGCEMSSPAASDSGYSVMFFLPSDVYVADLPVSYLSGDAVFGCNGFQIDKSVSGSRMVSVEFAFDCENIPNIEQEYNRLKNYFVDSMGNADYQYNYSGGSFSTNDLFWIGGQDTYLGLLVNRDTTGGIEHMNLKYGTLKTKQFVNEILALN